MDTIKLCALLARATYLVYVLKGDQVLDVGSAVAISKQGHLLTAAHVIPGLKASGPDSIDPAIRILARPTEGRLKPYRAIGGPFEISASYLKEPFVIDIAALEPQEPPEDEAVALPWHSGPIVAGIEVLMAGFSNEISPPFSWVNKVDNLQFDPDVVPSLQILQRHSGQLMIKRGMIGYAAQFHFEGSGRQLNGDTFYVDNAMHAGASGGPVVDSNGALLGIMIQRALTNMGQLAPPGSFLLPSGSAVAISSRTIQPFF